MPKGQFVHDTFEQLAEFGKSTAKQSVNAVKQTFNPLGILENTSGTESSDGTKNKDFEQKEKDKLKEKGHTPLDFDKLKNKYENQDKAKADALRNRLFQLVKQGEEKAIQDEKRKKEQKKDQEIQEQQQKKKQEEKRKQQEQAVGTPHGKERKSIFSAKKVAQRELTEVKPASGKQ